jgi:hypothetical protein
MKAFFVFHMIFNHLSCTVLYGGIVLFSSPLPTKTAFTVHEYDDIDD